MRNINDHKCKFTSGLLLSALLSGKFRPSRARPGPADFKKKLGSETEQSHYESNTFYQAGAHFNNMLLRELTRPLILHINTILKRTE